ncbi:ROK family protein [Aquiflexum lacus]|uniref:ROK family protein n=1 Tax=Aquiflexum lacus TaxID=2483805 RepID=UPI0018931CC0|nr:ROK family protein [Aquiflexum lacus]
MSNRTILAGDIGGSHITIGRFVENPGNILLEDFQRKQIDSYATKSMILMEWKSLIQRMVLPGESFLLSLAFPAPFDYNQGICLIQEQGKFKHLYEVNLRDELSELLGIPPSDIKFINDAQAFLLGETVFGQLNGAKRVLGLTLGSGLGSSIKKGQQVIDGELWKSPFRDGIAEDYLGSSWFVDWVKKETGIEVNGVKEIIQSQEIFEKAGSVFNVFADNLAEFILLNYPEIQMEKIILGGNISLSSTHFMNRLQYNLQRNGLYIPVEVSQLGEKSAVCGALTLFLEDNNQVDQNLILKSLYNRT